MLSRLGVLALLLGILLRVAACDAHVLPRGDVVLDVGVARSLAAGEGFASGFERGIPKIAGDPGSPVPPQDRADQHPPLWSLLASGVAWAADSPFDALKLLSFLCGLGLLALVMRMADRLTEGVSGVPDGLSLLAAGFVSASFVMVDASGNGSLYSAQALLVLALVELMAAPRPRAWCLGLVLGALLLLNHQCLVLLPLPLAVLLLAAPAGARGKALVTGGLAVALALLCQVPWWIRNAEVFGDPLHSVNDLYFLYRAGVTPSFAVEHGVPVMRFAQGLDPLLMLKASTGFVLPNVLYVLATGLLLWPMLLGIAGAALPGLVRTGLATRDRRLLGLLGALLVLGGVAVLWPATKLRYLVALQPLLVLLGVRALAEAPRRADRLWAWLLGLGWLALLALTAHDILGVLGGEPAPDARPIRWALLALGGVVLLGVPLVIHHRARRGETRAGLLTAGVVVSWGLAGVVAFGGGPGTAYHGTRFAPDFFGKNGELAEARDGVGLWDARIAAEKAGMQRVAGPVGLLAWPGPALVEVSQGFYAEWLALALEAIAEQGRVDGVVLLLRDAEGLPGFEPRVGARVLDDRLEVVDVVPEGATRSGCVVLRVAAG